MAGDNLKVIRYFASEGRTRKPQIQELLEGPVGDCAVRGWALNWAAVRRRENEAADEAATEGVYMAAGLAEQGVGAGGRGGTWRYPPHGDSEPAGWHP